MRPPQRHRAAPVRVNMTPMIDVTFQLIIFFMLVNTIIAEESIELIVPKVSQPQTKLLDDEDRLTINVAQESPILQGGVEGALKRYDTENALDWSGMTAMVKVGMEQYNLSTLNEMTASLKAFREKKPNIHILLRADAALHYEQVQPVMEHITMAGIETIKVVAYMPKEGPANLRAE
jgi:biopolymer transport protein ExbD